MPSDRVNIQLDINAGESPREPRVRAPNGPHRILVLGDFSGARPQEAPLGTRRPIRVDRDSIDDTIASFRPNVTVPLASGRQVAIDFSSLEEFHPDALYTRLPVFRELRSASANANTTARLAPPTAQGGVLDAILAELPMPAPGVSLGASAGETSHEGADSLDEFVRRAIAPHLVAAPTAADRSAAVQGDAVVAAALREVIHHSEYRGLETLWRGVDFLTRRLDTDAELQVWVLDASVDDLVEASADQTLGAQLIRTLIMASGGDSASSGWSVIVLPHEFDDTPEDLRLLELLGRVSASLGATLLAGASPRLLGADASSALAEPDSWRESSTLWTSVRRSPVARYIGLTAPRLLARVPYGAQADPCEVVRFEEIAADDVELCWLSGAFGTALLTAEALQRNHSFAGQARDIEDLPQHLYQREGEFVSTPCAEVLLSERSIAAILDRGIMPLVSKKDGDVVRLARLQSIAEPLAPLAPWASPNA